MPTEVDEIICRGGQPTQDRSRGSGDEPTQANTHGAMARRRKATRTDEEYALLVVVRCQATATRSVTFRRIDRKAREEISVAIC